LSPPKKKQQQKNSLLLLTEAFNTVHISDIWWSDVF